MAAMIAETKQFKGCCGESLDVVGGCLGWKLAACVKYPICRKKPKRNRLLCRFAGTQETQVCKQKWSERWDKFKARLSHFNFQLQNKPKQNKPLP
jgi:hypothetical protein